jgi:quercetin dioxygenase-like cupin family protein
MLHRFAVGVLGAAALAGAFGLGAVMSQQLTPATRVTALMKQVISEYPGHEVTMITLDIPPGGGSAPHRHPGHHTFGYVLEGILQDQAR